MSSTRYNYRAVDGRREQRYVLPELRVRLVYGEFATRNWSLGGLLVSDCREVVVPGTTLAGTFTTGEGANPVPFVAEAVRNDPREGELALKFVGLSAEGIDVLDRALARRLVRRRR